MIRKTLLIADDVEMNRAVIKRFFQHDYYILEASNGDDTLQVLKQEHVDILLLDIIMPGMNGLDVLKCIRETPEYHNIAILVATSTKEKTERMALNYGADDIVSKPYDPVIIRKRIQNILAKKALEKKVESIGLPEQEKVLFESMKQQYSVPLQEYIENIRSLAHIICENGSNEQMSMECASKILQKTDDIMHLFKMS